MQNAMLGMRREEERAFMNVDSGELENLIIALLLGGKL